MMAYYNSNIRHTKLTLVADSNSRNECPTLIDNAFQSILHKYRKHEATSLLSSSNIQIEFHSEFKVQYGLRFDSLFNDFLNGCRRWCEICKKQNWNVWLSTEMEEAYDSKGRSENIHQGLRLDTFSLGAMYDRYTFVEHGKHISPPPQPPITIGYRNNKRQVTRDYRSQLDFEHDSRFLSITYHDQDEFGRPTNESYRLRIYYNNMQEFFLVNAISGSCLTVYFMLKTPPPFHKIVKDTDPARLIEAPCFSSQVIGNSSVLAVTISNDSFEKIQAAISRMHASNFKIHWSHIAICQPKPLTPVPSFPDNFNLTYVLHCLTSQGYVITDRANGLFEKIDRLTPDEYDIAEKALQQLALQTEASLEGDRFIDLGDQFQKNFGIYLDSDDTEDVEQYDNCRYVRRAIVTPTRCILLPAELMSENRILRNFGEEFCMRIVFRDESFSKPSSFETSTSAAIGKRVVRFLTKGICIDLRHYQFLACSNSQLRDHGCWLYTRDDEGKSAADIRQWIGDFSRIMCVATYVSRMGQCFSTSEESVTASVADGEVEHEDDIKSCDGSYIFSDGIGRMSLSLAQRIATELNKNVQSAYQIRYSGCKGVIAIDPSLEGNKMVIRKSMNKFDSDHEGIEIMNNSKPSRLYLNRQAITLLSGLKIKDKVFKELQESMLYQHGRMFFYDEDAAESLTLRAAKQTKMNYRQLVKAGISLTNEPFFQGLLLAVYRNSIGQLQRRARIEIPSDQGRNMLGVLDETGILQYGQVFIQYSKNLDKPQFAKKICKGEVAITKFPALHPGDFRKFEAVDVEDLHHLVDCVVFPQQGPRPHPDEMAGSDLDGDEYFVTWMPDLIFDGENVEAMDFVSPPKKIIVGPIEETDMIQYIADYIKNDKVGLIANAHLALADSTNKGIFSTECIEIAEIHSKAVDFAKTGYSADLRKELRPTRYPDFMGKRDKSTYRSNEIIGALYRQCRQIDRLATRQKTRSMQNIPYDIALVHRGWQRFKQDSKRQYFRYTRQLEAIMNQYGITSESEILSGNIGRLGKRFTQRNEIHDAKNIIALKMNHLRNKTRREFFEEFGGRDNLVEFPEDCLAKASAWYMITYNQAEKTFISFPWIVADVLCKVRMCNPNASHITVTSVWRRLSIEADVYTPIATDYKLSLNIRTENPYHLDLPIIVDYIQCYPWLRQTAGVIIEWRLKRGLKKVLGKMMLLNLLLGFASQYGYLGDTDEDVSMKLLVEFFSFCGSTKFKEERHVPPGCHHDNLSKSQLDRVSAMADIAFHQLALCGTIHSIMEDDDDSNEKQEETIIIGNSLFASSANWQQKLKEEFPKVDVNVRRIGYYKAEYPRGRVTIRGPLSQVCEVQDRIEEWESDQAQISVFGMQMLHIMAYSR